MPTIGSGISSLANDILELSQQYNQEHRKYDEAYSLVEGLSRIGIDKRTGAPVQIQFDEKGKPLKDENIMTFGDPKAIEQYKNFNRRQAAGNMGRLDALGRIMASGISRAQAAAIEDASLSGQATRLRMQQAEQAFPLEQEQRQASTARTKQITEEEKAMIPLRREHEQLTIQGLKAKPDMVETDIGMMTPPQAAEYEQKKRIARQAAEEASPVVQFDRALLKKYGVTREDVIKATKGIFETQDPNLRTAKGSATGVPYVDLSGKQVSGEDYAKAVDTGKYKVNKPNMYAVVGPNKARIPVHEWSEIAAQAHGLERQKNLAKKFLEHTKKKEEAGVQLNVNDQESINWAKNILGQP